jgi:hypothetical protein
MFLSCECCVLSGRGFCDGLITRPEESYRMLCVVVCDLETSWMRRSCPPWGLSGNKKNVDECGSQPWFWVVVKHDSVFWRLRGWLNVVLVDWLLVLHDLETYLVTLTVYWFSGYLTMLFNWLECSGANSSNSLWKELLVHFPQIFLKRLRKTAIVTEQVLGHDLNSGIQSMNSCWPIRRSPCFEVWTLAGMCGLFVGENSYLNYTGCHVIGGQRFGWF